MQHSWDFQTDLVIVGSGGGGMVAALTATARGLNPLVLEKSSLYGGSTAMSGGAIWIPNNGLMKRAGLQDSPEEAFSYLKTITAGAVPADVLRAYIAAGPAMLSLLEQKSFVRYQIVPGYSDYYPRVPGGKPKGGRTIEPVPFSSLRLGADRKRIRPLPLQARLMGRLMATAWDAHVMLDTSLSGRLKAMRIFLSYFLNPRRSLYATDTRLTLGNSLIGRLRLSLARAGVPVWLDTPAVGLVTEQGRVTGVVARKEGREFWIGANRGVLLAAGGFAHNKPMRERHQSPLLSGAYSIACPDNTGDAIGMGVEAGAAVGLMDEAWWMPMSMVPGDTVPNMIIVERSLPGSILVNRRGRRFTNEAAPYIDVVMDQYNDHRTTGGTIPAYMIMDKAYRDKYPASPMLPRFTPKKYLDNGYLKKANDLESLAGRCGIDSKGLVATVTAFNENVRNGRDPEFHRGENAIDRFYGDAAVKPNPCLGSIEKPPFFAMEIWPGDLGTKGGLVIDSHARVLKDDGSPIPGLYATGNTTSSIMGRSYAGAGATIGPSLVFGYLGALHASGQK